VIAAPVVHGSADVADIRAAVERAGVVHIRHRMTAQAALDLGNRLGTVWAELRVHVDPGTTRFVLSPRPVPFHTDSARANLCAWYCVTPCRSPVTTFYLDGRDALSRVDAADQRRLERLRCADLMQGLAADQRPLVPVVQRRRSGAPRIFWLPHHLQLPTDPRDRAAAARLAMLLRGDGDAAVLGVQLGAGELVVVDNNRMLHGRGELPVDSPRQLYRMWIDTDGWSEAAGRQIRTVSALP
jgi:alpha-ketoglutarate-dependent taurine dioxygenase